MSTHPAQNAMQAANAIGQASILNAATSMGLGGSIHPSMMKSYDTARQSHSTNKTVFNGKIEVIKCANGYLVNIGRTEGYEFETHIAKDVQEVNQIIVSQMVAFRLEE